MKGIKLIENVNSIVKITVEDKEFIDVIIEEIETSLIGHADYKIENNKIIINFYDKKVAKRFFKSIKKIKLIPQRFFEKKIKKL